MTSPVLLTQAFDACISQLNCYDVDGCNHFAGSGTLTGLRSSADLSWSHLCCRLTPGYLCIQVLIFMMRTAMIKLRVLRS